MSSNNMNNPIENRMLDLFDEIDEDAEVCDMLHRVRLVLQRQHSDLIEEATRIKAPGDIKAFMDQGPFKLRQDWEDFYKILEKEKIKSFVHYTTQRNCESIKKNGLLSKRLLDDNHIQPEYISNNLSRNLDAYNGISNYIHLSIQKSPMMSAAEIRNNTPLVPLYIDRRIIFAEETLFSDKNSADKSATIGDTIKSFAQINFRIAKSEWKTENEKKLFQAEILVKNHIPIEYITFPKN